jgi:eukaryotic-like serine/threonine-protein kinase
LALRFGPLRERSVILTRLAPAVSSADQNDRPPGVPAVGDIVAGKYRIGRVLGSGGMGVVVAATHVQLGQELAIKFLHPEQALDAATVQRLLREARAVVPIRSEHVARVSDVGTLENGAPYMVMEQLSGSDLGQMLAARGPLPVAEVVEYLAQACEAIAEAHARGIVHRDLKPTNLFVTRRADGTPLVKVLDFGIAKAARADLDERTLTVPGQVMGSPHYMSPEQLKSSTAADARSDVWALGVVLYRLVSDRYPFEGQALTELSARIASEGPRPLREHLPRVPEALERAVERCLEKLPGRRFQTIAELARALTPLASPAALASFERIHRLSLEPLALRASAPDVEGETTEDYESPKVEAPARSAASEDETRSAWDLPPPAPRRWKLLAVAAAGFGVLVAASVVWTTRGSEQQASSVVPAAPPAPAPVAETAAPAPKPLPTPPPASSGPAKPAIAAPGPRLKRRAPGKTAPAASAAPAATPVLDPFGDRK